MGVLRSIEKDRSRSRVGERERAVLAEWAFLYMELGSD